MSLMGEGGAAEGSFILPISTLSLPLKRFLSKFPHLCKNDGKKPAGIRLVVANSDSFVPSLPLTRFLSSFLEVGK